MSFICCICGLRFPEDRVGEVDRWDWVRLCETFIENSEWTNDQRRWLGVCELCAPIDRAYKANPRHKNYAKKIDRHLEAQYEEVLYGKPWER